MNALAQIRPAFAHLIPPPAPTLRDLWLAAAEASEALDYRCKMSDDEWSRLEEAALSARQALIDHLLFEHGLNAAELRRSVL